MPEATAIRSLLESRSVARHACGYTAAGISIPVKFYDPVLQYYAMLVVSAATVAAFFVVSRSRVGKAYHPACGWVGGSSAHRSITEAN